ncbi:hypothetical protein [Deinococcus sp.]|uniref:hypothetical protein n=1 Tax=Deinococcus sp. TaxID=47478 RepID=UPI0028698D82|nr:hypothetical protein [Deinococcus sp.]
MSLIVHSHTSGMMEDSMGGTIVDAAVMRYALDRFEQHGRKATARDLGMVAGIVQGGR